MGYLKTTAMAVVAAVVLLAMAAEAQETQTCINKLVACAGSLNSTKPTESCCTSITEAVKTELPCLCNVFDTPGLLQTFNVTVAQALNLTKACGIPTNLKQCNSTLSPQPQPPSPVPGDGHNGAGTLAWTGVSTLCLFFVSTLFY